MDRSVEGVCGSSRTLGEREIVPRRGEVDRPASISAMTLLRSRFSSSCSMIRSAVSSSVPVALTLSSCNLALSLEPLSSTNLFFLS